MNKRGTAWWGWWQKKYIPPLAHGDVSVGGITYELRASGYEFYQEVNLSGFATSIASYSGGNATLANPLSRDIESFGEVPSFGSVDVPIWASAIESHLLSGNLASVAINASLNEIEAYGGLYAAINGPASSVEALSGGSVALALSKPAVTLSGISGVVGNAELSSVGHSLSATSGASITGALPQPMLSSYGGVTSQLSLSPIKALSATGVSGSVAYTAIKQPTRTLKAYSGASTFLSSFTSTIHSDSSLGTIGTAVISRFSSSLIVEVTQPTFGFAVIRPPEIGTLWGISAVGQFTSQITAFGDGLVASENIAYAMTISSAETTQYTNYDFDYIVRLGGKYYGFKPDGMFLLEGTSDDGTEIVSRFKTSMLDFETALHKRVPYLYIDTEFDTTVTPYVEGALTGSYTAGHNGRRVRLARGPRGRQWEFEVSNLAGNDMKVGSLELFAQVLSRKV